jgi:hypothetical protein
LLILLLLFQTRLLYEIKRRVETVVPVLCFFHELNILLPGISMEWDEEWSNESAQTREQDANTKPCCSLNQDSDHHCQYISYHWTALIRLECMYDTIKVISASVQSF